MKEVIDMLLQKQASLEADKEAEKALACEKIDEAYAERSVKIASLLEMAGYVPTVDVEENAECETVEEVAEEETADAPAIETAGVQTVY